MTTLDKDIKLIADEADGAEVSTAALESQLVTLEDQLEALQNTGDNNAIALTRLQMARVKLGLDDNEEAWAIARDVFPVLIKNEQWELAVDACDVMFLSEQEGSLQALGQGIWLAVTYPIDPELTIKMLEHIIEETADDADGAAVAGATAVYIADLRCDGKQRENLTFFANQLLGTVARRHSEVETAAQFDFWVKKMELNDPQKFLVRLRNVVDVLVQDDWWIDREELQSRLPEN